MFKNSTLILSSIAVMSLLEASAQITNCTSNINCSGFFYEEINAAFIDCFDSNGILQTRKENFYTSTLEKQCNSTYFSDFNISLNGTSILANLSDNTTVNYCDYFEVGVGY